MSSILFDDSMFAVRYFLAVLICFGFFLLCLSGYITDFWRWLKGSRRIVPLLFDRDGKLASSNTKIGLLALQNSYPIIEISRGPFRCRSTLYGKNSKNWKIARDWFDPILDAFHGDWVSLMDDRGLPIEQALQLINTYPSLQAMLDRIANLEKELGHARFKVTERAASLQALNQKLTAEKQRFRGSPAKEIQANIQFVLRETGEQHVYRDMVVGWLEKLEKTEAN